MSATAKPYKGIGMDSAIAHWYGKNASRNIGEYRKDAERVAQRLRPGGHALEIASGPGYQAIELAKLDAYRVLGVDISKTFVRIATQNARAAGVDVQFLRGNASDLRLGADQFDLVYCRAAFKNFAHPAKALAEMHRVLRQGGIGLIQDLRPDASDQAIADTVRALGVGWLSRLIITWTFKHMLVKRAHPRERLEAMAAASPFGRCEIHESPIGYEVVLKK